MINSCSHRGAMLASRKSGDKTSFTCPFHGWTFNDSGNLLQAKDEKTGEVYGFENGHMLLWTRALNPEVRPIYK